MQLHSQLEFARYYKHSIRYIRQDCIRCPDPYSRLWRHIRHYIRHLFSLPSKLGTRPCKYCHSSIHRHNNSTNTVVQLCTLHHCSFCTYSCRRRRQKDNRCRDRYRRQSIRRFHPRRCLFSRRYTPYICCRTSSRSRIHPRNTRSSIDCWRYKLSHSPVAQGQNYLARQMLDHRGCHSQAEIRRKSRSILRQSHLDRRSLQPRPSLPSSRRCTQQAALGL
jgi:hypothetical protein